MQNLRKRLLKIRLMSAVLATVELTNIGTLSYAVKPSESEVISIDEIKKMSVKDLFEYLKKGYTDQELRRYYEGDNDAIEKDVMNFDLLAEEKKNEFFEYIGGLACRGELKDFVKLPMEIKTEFFNYVIKNHDCDFKKIVDEIVRKRKDTFRCGTAFWLDCINSLATPRMTGLIIGKYNEGKNSAIDAITNHDLNVLIRASTEPDFAYDEETSWLQCSLIDYAALIGNAEAFKFLMMNGAKVTKKTKKYALMGENFEIIHLIEQYVGGYSEVTNDEAVLRGLVSANRGNIFNWLQKFGKTDEKKFFMAYCKTDNILFLIDVLKMNYPENFNKTMQIEDSDLKKEITKLFLLETGIDVNAIIDNEKRTALIWTAIEDNAGVAKLLIENGADLNKADDDGKTPLIWTAIRNNVEVAELLIENGADLNQTDGNGKTALIWAARTGNAEVTKLLIENGVDLNETDEDGYTALMWAARNDNIEIVKLLIRESEINLNVVDQIGCTALMCAAKRGKQEIVRLLVESGADINVADANGQTVLIYAIYKRKTELAEFLIENGADLDIADEDGRTALIWAINRGNLEIVELLVEKGADIDATDIDGDTALILAVLANNAEVVSLLIESGADMNIADEEGKTALAWAIKNKNVKLIKLLTKNKTDD